MTWQWPSYEDYKDHVNPVMREQARFGVVRDETRFENVERMVKAIQKITSGLNGLKQMGYAEDPPAENKDQLHKARLLVEDIVYTGEDLLLLHRRLAQSRWADDFIHEKELDKHWDRYEAEGRIFRGVAELVCATDTLLEGFDHFFNEDQKLLVGGLSLPNFLLQDFRLARDLFSVGFDEVGALMAGRGLEGVLRQFAAAKGIRISHQGKERAASEADFRDLIEVFHRLRWSRDRSRLIDQDTKSLLDLLRTVRNSTAHPNQRRQQRNWRELAIVMSTTANALWKDAERKRARLVTKVVNKDW